MLAALAALALTASTFPLPAIDGKPLALTPGQKSFRLPMRFEKVKAFYDEQFKGSADVTVRAAGTPGNRSLVIANRNKSDRWMSATVKEGELETVVDLKQVLELDGERIDGKAPPVNFILTRSAEVQKSLDTIDHTESMRAR